MYFQCMNFIPIHPLNSSKWLGHQLNFINILPILSVLYTPPHDPPDSGGLIQNLVESDGFQTCHISSHGCPPDSCQIPLDSGRVKTDWGPQSGVQWSPPESAGLCWTVELKVDCSPQRGSSGVHRSPPDSAGLWS